MDWKPVTIWSVVVSLINSHIELWAFFFYGFRLYSNLQCYALLRLVHHSTYWTKYILFVFKVCYCFRFKSVSIMGFFYFLLVCCEDICLQGLIIIIDVLTILLCSTFSACTLWKRLDLDIVSPDEIMGCFPFFLLAASASKWLYMQV